MTRLTSIGVRVAAVLLAIVGSMIWTSRLDYTPNTVFDRFKGAQLTEIEGAAITDLATACDEILTEGGWIVFVLIANLISDSAFRSYFETSTELNGLWVEYDYGLLRLGLGLGPDSPDPSTAIPIRTVRQDERATVTIAVTRNQTRVVTNAIDKQKVWPGEFAEGWKCDAVQIGSDVRELSEGNTCIGCRAELFYMTGIDQTKLTQLLDSVSNVQAFNTRRILGSALTMTGVFIVLFLPRRLLRTRASQANGKQSRQDQI